ncbi:MAG: fructose-bisphosphatase class III [Anaerotardibacter sp.]
MSTNQEKYFDSSFERYLEEELTHAKEKLGKPKATELFLSDIHGEYNAFAHVLKNGCGSIRAAIDELFGEELSEEERATLATLIYYPEEKLEELLGSTSEGETLMAGFLCQLGVLYNHFAKNFTPFEVKSAVTGQAYSVVDVLMVENLNNEQAKQRANAIAHSRIAGPAIFALCHAVQRLSYEKLHLVGDIYDRGPCPDLIMDELMNHPSVDIQWGNHDILWMGASLGQPGCIANVVRICARYGNLNILEETYGIDLSELTSFAKKAYKDDPCVAFGLKGSPEISEEEQERSIKIQKAMAIIQFKVEAQLIAENPSFNLEDRNLLDKINYEEGTVLLDGVTHELTDKVFPTVDPENPFQLTRKEKRVMNSLVSAFKNCQRLQDHIKLFIEAGSLYKITNNMLLFHACVPLNEDGSMKEVSFYGNTYKGKALFDAVDGYVRDAFSNQDPETKKQGLDLLWYLWLGEGSPLFAKSKMATFELYLIADKAARKEVKNSFYSLYEKEEVINAILEDFGMDPSVSRIVCGHTPVKVKDGEDPVKCGGKVIVIDGGMSKAYQSSTGIAGFALISTAESLELATLTPLQSKEDTIANNKDILPQKRVLATYPTVLVEDTDDKNDLLAEISALEEEIASYQS